MAEEDLGKDTLFFQNLDLPPEVIRDVTVRDVLPKGLIYRSESLKVSGACRAASQIFSDPNDGSEEVKIILSFGEVNNSGNQDLQIGFETVVADVPDNKAGTVLPPRRAYLSWRDEEGVLHTFSAQSEEVHIIEPDLQMERWVAGSNDTVEVTLSIHHSSRSLAPDFDVDLVESLPQGMSLCPGSARILSGPSGETEESGSARLKWHFDVLDSFWAEENGIVLSYMANLSGEVQGGISDPRASLVWTSMPGENPDERAYSLKGEGSLSLQDVPAGLVITMTDDPDPVSAGGALNYTINYRNSGQNANDAVVKVIYDKKVTFSSAFPEPDDGTEDHWTIGDLSSGDDGEIRVTVRVRTDAPMGSGLASEAEISSGAMNATATALTTVKTGLPLTIEASSSREFLSPGSIMNYTLCFRNGGQEDATNVTVTDILDNHLLFDETKDASPPPSAIWRDKRGIVLHWKAEALGTEVMHPGQSGQISLRVQLPSGPDYKVEHLSNLYRIDSNQSLGEFRSLETFVVRSLFIRKKAEKGSYSEGDTVNYTIVYGNELSTEVTDAEITDLLPDVEYLGASPEPDYQKDNLLAWRPGRIPGHSSATIRLMVRIREMPEVRFSEYESVSGSGLLSSVQTLDTSRPIRELTNRANITAYCLNTREQDSCSSSIRLLDAFGIELQRARHGSGYSNATETIYCSTRDGIRVVEQSQSRFSPVTLSLSRENLTLASPWADRTRAENFARRETLSESCLYMDLIEKKGTLFLDPNQTAFTYEELISGGKEEMSYRQTKAKGFIEVSERYHGDFKIGRRLDSYGSRASYLASASGQGFASSEKRMASPSSAAESYWHGSGSLDSDELFSSDPVVRKNVEMVYGVCAEKAGSFRVNYSSPWSEGTSASDKGQGSLVSSTVSSAGSLQKEALMDSSSLFVFEKFYGRAMAKAVVSKGSRESVIWEQDLAGNYTQAISLCLHHQPEFLGPRLRRSHTLLFD